ncbi:hypothetical protein ONZ45_g1201 [Pleurotus djamor]|nr:hypothetical protein ONZ45_g1201 [Pleurotus djamor]
MQHTDSREHELGDYPSLPPVAVMSPTQRSRYELGMEHGDHRNLGAEGSLPPIYTPSSSRVAFLLPRYVEDIRADSWASRTSPPAYTTGPSVCRRHRTKRLIQWMMTLAIVAFLIVLVIVLARYLPEEPVGDSVA